MSVTLSDIVEISIAMLIILVTLWNRVITTSLNSGDNICLNRFEDEELSKPYSKCGRCD
jgi:hypothetical protein